MGFHIYSARRYIKRVFVFLNSFFLLAFVPLLHAEDDCSAEPLCVTVAKNGSEITVSIENTSTQDASAEFEWQLENVEHRQANTSRYVIRAGESKTVSILDVIDVYKTSKYAYSYKWVYGNSDAKHDDSTLYLLPYKAGTQQYVSQSCNGRMSHSRGNSQNAIDFGMRKGTEVYAARAGTVVDLHEVSVSGGTSELHLDDANYVKLQHSDGTIASYVHLRTMGVKVNIGDAIKAGQFIGYSGDTGYSSGPHLHFQVLQTNAVEDSATVAVKWKTTRGVLTCPRRGLALKAI